MRVEAAGGYVWWDRVMGELAVSSAIKDHCFVPYVIPDPEVGTVRSSAIKDHRCASPDAKVCHLNGPVKAKTRAP